MNINLREALDLTMRNLNLIGSDKERTELVTDWFSRQHRTLQQMYFKVIILPILRHMAEQYRAGAYDMRNQAAVDLAHKMTKDLTESDTYLPLI